MGGALVASAKAGAIAGPWKAVAAILAGGGVFVLGVLASFGVLAQFVVIGVSCAPGTI
jgi:hypothetical protein